MPGFLEGLKELLLGGYQPQAGAMVPTGGYDAPDASGIAAPTMLRQAPVQGAKQPGLLQKLGHYVTSPEGMLTLGTTLRAGTGDENAFSDQERILTRKNALERQAKSDTDAQALNDLFASSMKVDPATGKARFDNAAFAEGLAALKGKTAIDPAKAVELLNAVSPKNVPVGKHVARIDPLGGDVQWAPDAPLDEEDIEDRESRRALRDAQIGYYNVRTEAVPEDVATRRYRAEHPASARPRAAPVTPDFSHMTNQEIDNYIAHKTKR